MRTTETRVVPAQTRDVVVKVTCDLCGATTTDKNHWFERDSDERNSVVIEHSKGYQEGGESANYQTTFFDCCPTCFVNKLVPWFRQQGTEPQTEQTHY